MSERDACELTQKGTGNIVRIEIDDKLTVRVTITSPTGNNVDTGEFPSHASAFELAAWLETHKDW